MSTMHKNTVQTSIIADDMISERLHADNFDAAKPASVIGVLGNMIGSVVEFVARAYTRRSVYSRLNNLSDRMLADIGLTRSDIRQIAEKAGRQVGATGAVRTQRFIRRSADVIAFKGKSDVVTPVADDKRKAA